MGIVYQGYVGVIHRFYRDCTWITYLDTDVNHIGSLSKGCSAPYRMNFDHGHMSYGTVFVSWSSILHLVVHPPLSNNGQGLSGHYLGLLLGEGFGGEVSAL